MCLVIVKVERPAAKVGLSGVSPLSAGSPVHQSATSSHLGFAKSFRELPARYRRKPLDEVEIEYIQVLSFVHLISLYPFSDLTQLFGWQWQEGHLACGNHASAFPTGSSFQAPADLPLSSENPLVKQNPKISSRSSSGGGRRNRSRSSSRGSIEYWTQFPMSCV